MRLLIPFFLLDIFFLNKIQRFSHWSQRNFGMNNFWWARFFIRLAFGIDLFRTVKFEKSLILLAIDLIIVIFLWRACHEAEKEFEDSSKTRAVNKRVYTWISYRIGIIIWWGFTIPMNFLTFFLELHWESLLFAFIEIAVIVFVYLVSCTPLPPCESKAGAWLKSKKKGVIEALSPSPEPVPVKS